MRRTAVSKLILLAIVALLLSTTSCSAARPDPVLLRASEFEGVRRGEDRADEGCEGEEDCDLMRRTLAAAHLDYIYTQHQKHKH